MCLSRIIFLPKIKKIIGKTLRNTRVSTDKRNSTMNDAELVKHKAPISRDEAYADMRRLTAFGNVINL